MILMSNFRLTRLSNFFISSSHSTPTTASSAPILSSLMTLSAMIIHTQNRCYSRFERKELRFRTVVNAADDTLLDFQRLTETSA